MPRIPVTEAESAILAALWHHGPLPFTSLIEAVKTERPWGDATIKTLLGRLMRKGAIRSERADGRLTYRALIARRDYIDGEIQSLADRLFGGRVEELVAHLRDRDGRP